MGFSAKLFEVVVYPESFDVNKLEEILGNSAIKDYAYILHDKDNKKEHIHIAIRTIDSRQSDYVAKWFGVLENAVGRVKGKWSDMLKYLTHRNAPDKHQYDDDEVKSNFDWKKAVAKGEENIRLDGIIEDIANGKIREYNYTQYITDREYIKYKRQIETAFNYRKDKLRGEKREMEGIFITGDSGLGKTTYAKLICEEKGYSYFVSSGSNDVLDGYMGEEVVILDDLRPSCMGLSDLLKMLDNHTASTVKSRYKNKVLECKLIIITSVLGIDKFFHNVFTEEKETIVQLKRRCKTYIRMHLDTIDIMIYDDYLRDYDLPITAKNPIANMYKAKRLSRAEQIDKLKEMLGNVEIEERERNWHEKKCNVEIFPIFGEKSSLNSTKNSNKIKK